MTSPPAVASPGDVAHRARVAWGLWLGLLSLEVLKHGVLWGAGQAQPWGDSTVYWRMAESVAAGDVWLAAEPVAYRTPGYPWYLGACLWLGEAYGLQLAVIGQHLAVMATSVLIARMTYELTASRRAAVIAWLIAIGSTARPLQANWLLTEPLATACLTGCAWCWLQSSPATRTLHAQLAAGVCLGVGILIRPALVAALPVMLGASIWRSVSEDRHDTRRLWSARRLEMIAPLLLCGVTLVPWCWRNERLFDRFTLCVFTGRQLWKATFSPRPGAELPIPETAAGGELRTRLDDAAVDLRNQWSVAPVLSRSGLNDAEVDALMERVAWQAIGEAPGRAAWWLVYRTGTFWYCWDWATELREDPAPEQASGFYADQARPRWSKLTEGVMHALASTPERWWVTSVTGVLLAWGGLLRLVWFSQTRRTGRLFAALFIMTTLLTATLEVPTYRYRSVLEPLLIVAAVAGWSGGKAGGGLKVKD